MTAHGLAGCRWHRRSFRFVAYGLLASAAGVAGGIPSARAQPDAGAGARDAGASAPAAGEIVVTATKRSTRLDQTPMSITALTGAQLAKNGITDVQSALQGVPGVAFATAGPGKTVFNIRGLSSSGGAAATVGFYIDDVPISSPAHSTNGKTAIDPSLYDLAQVEVLRGPQGTLYGASAMGGTIKLETNQPRPGVFAASAHVGASTPATGGVGYAADVMVNLPIVSDTVALRVVASQKYDNGYVDRIVNRAFPAAGGATRGDVVAGPTTLASTRGGDNSLSSLRAALLIRPVAGVDLTGSILRQRQHQNDQGLVDVPPGGLVHVQPADVAEPSRDDVTIYSLVGKLDLGRAQLQSSSSWMERKITQTEDESEVLATLLGSGYPAGVDFIPSAIAETHPEHAFTEEVRLTSTGTHTVDWLLGGYYSTFTDSWVDAWQVDALASNPNFGTADVFHYDERDRISQVAAFGQATWHIAPRLQATAGLRWFHYDNSYGVTQSGLFAGLSDTSGREARSGVTPKFDVQYQITPHNMVYATVAKGYRPGGANVAVPLAGALDCTASLAAIGINGGQPGPYGPDSLWNYEVGAKNSFFANRLSVHAAGFYIDWQHIQQQVVLACGYNITQNLGHAVSKGFDFDFSLKIGENWRLSGGGGLTDARLQQDTAAGGLAGQQLQNVPLWTHNLEGEYRRPLGTATAVGLATYRHVSSSYDVLGQHPAYDTVDVRTGVEWAHLRAYVYARNLTDQRPILSYANDLGVNIANVRRAAVMRPRTIGVDLSYTF